MPKRHFLVLSLILALCLLAGCERAPKEPFVGATSSGSLDKEEPGSNLMFTIEIEDEGDPVGIDFRGVLTAGSVKLQIVDAEDDIYKEWTFDELGTFSLNTTLYPPPGTYRYGMAWDGPVQLAQYGLAWKPHPIETPEISPLVLLPGIGMLLVALGFVIYVAVRKLGWRYLGLGALGWVITVALKFAWAIPFNSPVYEALKGSLPEAVANAVFYIYVGALTGVFEVGIVWLVLRYTKLGNVAWERAQAFGFGFGGIEAALLGLNALVGAATVLIAPAALPLGALEQVALANNPIYGLAPIWERFFTVLVHLFSNVLLFYGARKRESRWFWLAFAYKSGIDAIAAWGQLTGLDTLGAWAPCGPLNSWWPCGALRVGWGCARYGIAIHSQRQTWIGRRT